MNTVKKSSQQGQASHGLGRRDFIKAAGVTAVGAGLAQTPLSGLASEGGEKCVTVPKERISALKRWPRYGAAEKKRLHEMIDQGVTYAENKQLEKEWAAYTGTPFAKAHMNGSSALTSMYFALSLDVPPGSEVMVPSYTFFSACLALRFSNLVPVFIDIDPKTACFDLEDAKRKLTPRTVAVEVMHSWGLPCEMDAIFGWAKAKGLVTLEDASHAHGASMQGKKIGTWGDMAALSYQASKPLPAIEGGMGMYKTREYFERAAAFGHYEDPGTFPKESPVYAYAGTGYGQKYRMHPYAAALARMQLKGLDEVNATVMKNVRAVNDRLIQLPGITEPHCRADQQRVYYSSNMVLVDFKALGVSRDAVVKALKAEGVDVGFWDYPLQHKMKIYAEAKWWHHPPVLPEKMPGGDHVNANHLMLPLFYGDASEVNGQYVKAFEKVWAHRSELTAG
ncbi:MAG TPA: DegT/DnrJ/EryC1/StrS family aminotransferase [Kiritimatiellia bacterium]|nr:DegT/DnrJ/EryC1/StrS family aminotransferase [Kiritimatiellia bacterium]HPS05910.1 DegT/DnrJ/EryC1/StrS family aminotransferase [Kiritimatiellia bacterium]